jgi:hypothetical protein
MSTFVPEHHHRLGVIFPSPIHFLFIDNIKKQSFKTAKLYIVMKFHNLRGISFLAAAFFLHSLASAESGGFLEYPPDYVVNWAQTHLGNNGSNSIAAFEKRSDLGLFERQETCPSGYGYCSSTFHSRSEAVDRPTSHLFGPLRLEVHCFFPKL